MGVFNPNNVKIGPGVLFAAPLGTTEPSSVTAAWPAGWVELGYTDQGSEFDFGPATAPVEVEEEFWPIKQAITSYSGKLMFALAEQTRQNLAISLNAGVGSSLQSTTQGTNGDGSIWQEPPNAGSEVRLMLGWDALPYSAEPGGWNYVAGQTIDPFGRLVCRQCLQTGQVKRLARKGNNKSTYAVEFSLEKPYGVQPFRFTFEPNQAS